MNVLPTAMLLIAATVSAGEPKIPVRPIGQLPLRDGCVWVMARGQHHGAASAYALRRSLRLRTFPHPAVRLPQRRHQRHHRRQGAAIL